MELGYHVSHEQFSPAELLRLCVAAEKAGFTTANSSDPSARGALHSTTAVSLGRGWEPRFRPPRSRSVS